MGGRVDAALVLGSNQEAIRIAATKRPLYGNGLRVDKESTLAIAGDSHRRTQTFDRAHSISLRSLAGIV